MPRARFALGRARIPTPLWPQHPSYPHLRELLQDVAVACERVGPGVRAAAHNRGHLIIDIRQPLQQVLDLRGFRLGKLLGHLGVSGVYKVSLLAGVT